MTEIVEVYFIKDTQSLQTGNEFYTAGSQAHFFVNQAYVLVEQGRAVFIDNYPVDVELLPVLDYSKMTVKQLREVAHERGVKVSGLRKAEMIAALES